MNFDESRVVEQLLSDVVSDVEFIWNNFQAKNLVDIIKPENICYISKKGAFFLSNWGALFEGLIDDKSVSNIAISRESTPTQLSSKNFAEELKALALLVLKIKKIECKEIESLQRKSELGCETYYSDIKKILAESFPNCEKLQQLFGKMLSSDPRDLPKLEEMKKSQNPVCVDSSQANMNKSRMDALLKKSMQVS